ncbi:MAG: hypothetical protein AAFU85_33535, partial [Planctomycetota bacterium]
QVRRWLSVLRFAGVGLTWSAESITHQSIELEVLNNEGHEATRRRSGAITCRLQTRTTRITGARVLSIHS